MRTYHQSITNSDHVKKELIQIARRCNGSPNLDNHEEVGKVVSKLITFSACVRCPIVKLLKDKEVHNALCSVRSYLSRAEFFLEYEHARKICSSSNPQKTMKDFPFYNDYVNLARSEYHFCRSVSPKAIQKALFIGSGPLSMTSVCLCSQDNIIQIDNMDIDLRAAVMCQKVINELNLTHRIKQVPGDVRKLEDTDGYDVIILAALVGSTTQEKIRIIQHLASIMTKGQLLLIRTTSKSRTFLYPSIEAKDIVDLEVLSEVRYMCGMVNAAIIARKA